MRKRYIRSIILLLAVGVLFAAAPGTATASCTTPANAIERENCLPGANDWDISGAGSVQGFATDISVDQGATVAFKIDATAAYTLDIYRLGYYGGDGARNVGSAQLSAPLPLNQPACQSDVSIGLTDCGNWNVSATWAVPGTAVSGIYLAVAKRGGGAVGHIPFVVRDDDGGSALLFQTSDTTWQAYNRYGLGSLYTGSGPGPEGSAHKVSYNRPFTTRAYAPEDWIFNAEYPMVRWLERNGYDVSYFTGVDSDRIGTEIREHKAFLSVGHDEYWSGEQRTNVEAARDAGVNLAFFSGNEVFWKTRWENNHRTLVTYKETHADAKIDPTSAWTGTWRDPRFSPPADGGRPENALTGTIFTVNAGADAVRVPAEDGKLRFWRNAPVADLLPGTAATLTGESVGYEWDEDLDNGARPAGLVRMSSTTVENVDKLLDYGSSFGPGTATHNLTLYRDTNGGGPAALVFGAGTVQWSWGLDGDHDRGGGDPDRSMQQATLNLLADMGAQPATIQSDLVATGASTDLAPPSTTITSPVAGTSLQPGEAVVVQGTAADAGGRVGAVEVSVDDGATWHPATGRDTWSYVWTPDRGGQTTLRARAADDSANLGTASAGVPVTIGDGRTCPCSLFGGRTPFSASENDLQPIEVGVRFRPDEDGTITGLRHYKGEGWTGTRSGHLWTADGAQLASVTFANETGSGWQEAQLASPVPVSAGTTYVASYLSPSGHYSADTDFFVAPFDAPPLHAPSDRNGVYVYGGGFPNATSDATNYWADVRFMPLDEAPPRVISTEPVDGATGVAPGTQVRATFDEPLDLATVTTGSFQLRTAGGAVVPASVSYAGRTATLAPDAPLAAGSRYTATLTSGVKDLSGNALAPARTWSFTVAAASPGRGPGGEPFDLPPGTTPGGSRGTGTVSADRVAPRVRLRVRRARVSRAGVVRLAVTCANEHSCRVDLRLRRGRRTVASRTLTVTGTRNLGLRLSRGARSTLARKGSLRLVARLTARDVAGNRTTTNTLIRIAAPRGD